MCYCELYTRLWAEFRYSSDSPFKCLLGPWPNITLAQTGWACQLIQVGGVECEKRNMVFSTLVDPAENIIQWPPNIYTVLDSPEHRQQHMWVSDLRAHKWRSFCFWVFRYEGVIIHEIWHRQSLFEPNLHMEQKKIHQNNLRDGRDTRN